MRIVKPFLLLGAFKLAVFLTACGTGGKPAAVDVNPEVDVCIYCNMAVPDNEHATQMILADGTVFKYDDIGCMIKHEAENEFDVAVAYVRDAHSKEWVDLEEATFFYEETIHTPMGYGMLSFKEAAGAEAMLEDYPYGVIMSLTDMRNHILSHDQEHQMEHQDGHGHQEEITHESLEPQVEAD